MKRFILLLVMLLFLSGCDTALLVKGIVVEGDHKSIAAKDRILGIDTSNRIPDVQFALYPHVSPAKYSTTGYARNFKSDSLGRFNYNATIGPGTYNAALISSKEGYLADTIIFEYTPLQPESLIIVLKKIK